MEDGMPHIVFVDDKLDWSNFSVVGNLRQLYGDPSIPVEMYDKCDLSKLDPIDDLFLSGHGSSSSSGKFKTADDLALVLEKGNLKKEHKLVVLLTCSSADTSASLNCFAAEMQISLQKIGYKSVSVMGGTGRVVVGPLGREALLADTLPSEALGLQTGEMAKHPGALAHCKLLVDNVMKGSRSPHDLAQTADLIAAKLTSFYADLMAAFKPMLKSDKQAYAIYR
jgi:hypothetical protein